ncbi:MAG: hypothetical protein F6K58_21515 [Symploca sp. SIO2E9]|nr:hypothetical protein [Symploca sp. SIO2E9]
MKEQGVRYSRMLSNFAYTKEAQMLESRCNRWGIQLIQVNPAYSSLIGLTKFMRQYGLSSDTAAALALARRALYKSERIPASYGIGIPEDRPKHVWSYWNCVGKKLKGVPRHRFFLMVANSESEVNLLGEEVVSTTRLSGKSRDTSDGRRNS